MKIAIIGLGYVGLPLALEFGKKYITVGYDSNVSRINELKISFDRNNELKKSAFKSKKLSFTSNESLIANSNFYIITVPTPIHKNKKPNLSLLKKATKTVSEFIRKGDTVIYESTVYPGVTENICSKILNKNSGLILNKDFFLGYSPERINPGDKKLTLTKIKKLVSASTPKALRKVDLLYKSIIPVGTYKVKSIKIAEAAKVIENTQRDINIAYMNELIVIFDKLNINTQDVIKAASTKWNFLNFKPGLVGGHCIGVDPYYLHYISNVSGYNTKLILAGRRLNDNMPRYFAKDFLKKFKIHRDKNDILSPKILFLGLAFKANTSDLRNSKSIKLCKILIGKLGAKSIDACDPLVNQKMCKSYMGINLISLKKINLANYNAIIYAVNHRVFSKLKILQKNNNLLKYRI